MDFDSRQIFFRGGLIFFFGGGEGGIQNNLKLRGSVRAASSTNNVQPNKVRHSVLSGNFSGSELRHRIFGGLKFGPGIFRILLKKPWGYFIIIIFSGGEGVCPIRSFSSVEIRSTLSGKTSQVNTVSILFTFPSGVCDIFNYRFK